VAKIDLKKELKHLYNAPSKKPSIVEVPALNYIMVNGHGHPDEQSFQDAASTIFPVAYIMKFNIKAKKPEHDYVVMPLEVKWSLHREEKGFKRYSWTMMVMQPEFATEQDYSEALEKAKQKADLPSMSTLRFESITEGLCAQILHRGPYGEPMEETFAVMKQELSKLGYHYETESHDIYFNDIRRTPAEKLKTIIRIRIFENNK
jgi:hypothetical protein